MIFNLVSLVLKRAKQRNDTEAEQAFVRCCAYLTLYFPVIYFADPLIALVPVVPMCNASVALTFILLVWSLIDLRASPSRRISGMLLDVVTPTLSLYAAGPSLSFSLLIYVWVTFAYGVRYGVKYLYLGLVLGVFGLLFLANSAPFWSEYSSLTLGYTVGFTVLSIYAGRLVKLLHNARSSAEAANRAKTRFLASMSHEIRTPLTTIIGSTEMLQRTLTTAGTQSRLALISRSANELMTLVDNLLDFSKADADKLKLKPKAFNIYALLGSIFQTIQLRAENNSLTAQLKINASTPPYVIGDALRLQQILSNLLGNAIKYTPSGFICLSVDIEKLSDSSVHFIFKVEDSGIGIPTSQRDKIFHPFTQIDESHQSTGAGLGLSIVGELVNAFGGQIQLKSAIGIGSTFSVTLPFRLDPAAYNVALEPITIDYAGSQLTRLQLDTVLSATHGSASIHYDSDDISEKTQRRSVTSQTRIRVIEQTAFAKYSLESLMPNKNSPIAVCCNGSKKPMPIPVFPGVAILLDGPFEKSSIENMILFFQIYSHNQNSDIAPIRNSEHQTIFSILVARALTIGYSRVGFKHDSLSAVPNKIFSPLIRTV